MKVNKPYKKFPGDIEMEKGFKYALHFVSVIDNAGGLGEKIDLNKMSAMDLLNLFNTNDIYLTFRPPKGE